MTGMNYDWIPSVQFIKLLMLDDDTFDLLSRKDQFDFRDPTKDAKFEHFVDEVMAETYSDVQVLGICNDVTDDVIVRFPTLSLTSNNLKDDLKDMYSLFDQSHPTNSLRKENNLITGK